MKIAFIGGRDIHKLGGIENYMYNLATELVKLGHPLEVGSCVKFCFHIKQRSGRYSLANISTCIIIMLGLRR